MTTRAVSKAVHRPERGTQHGGVPEAVGYHARLRRDLKHWCLRLPRASLPCCPRRLARGDGRGRGRNHRLYQSGQCLGPLFLAERGVRN